MSERLPPTVLPPEIQARRPGHKICNVLVYASPRRELVYKISHPQTQAKRVLLIGIVFEMSWKAVVVSKV